MIKVTSVSIRVKQLQIENNASKIQQGIKPRLHIEFPFLQIFELKLPQPFFVKGLSIDDIARTSSLMYMQPVAWSKKKLRVPDLTDCFQSSR